MVVNDKASPSLLDTYEADRLPIMRGVLFKTDKLTTVIGAENAVVRTLYHLGPFIRWCGACSGECHGGHERGRAQLPQQFTVEDHTHGGALRAAIAFPT